MLCVIHETFINISAHVALVKRSGESSLFLCIFFPISFLWTQNSWIFCRFVFVTVKKKGKKHLLYRLQVCCNLMGLLMHTSQWKRLNSMAIKHMKTQLHQIHYMVKHLYEFVGHASLKPWASIQSHCQGWESVSPRKSLTSKKGGRAGGSTGLRRDMEFLSRHEATAEAGVTWDDTGYRGDRILQELWGTRH